jgi:uncharacterized protein with NAD-binding domain and iron-sulfur cluster
MKRNGVQVATNIDGIKNKRIIIFGAGISGLTCAHELLDKGFDVEIHEKLGVLGGMAKSRTESNGLFSEHSWRGWAPFYKNFYNIAKRIPIGEGKTVYDNLSKPIKFHMMEDEDNGIYEPQFTIWDKVRILYESVKYMSSDDRKQAYNDIAAIPYLKGKLSDDGHKYMSQFVVGPGYGMDKNDASYIHFMGFLTKAIFRQNIYDHYHDGEVHKSTGDWHEFSEPTNEGWFIPWKEYLKSMGVKFHMNSELVKLNISDDKIISCIVKKNSTETEISADDFVLCISPFTAKAIFEVSGMTKLFKQHKKLVDKSLSQQVSFRLGLKKEIKYPFNEMGFTMTDSEYNITWFPQEKYLKNVSMGEFKSLWSGTCIIPYQKGKLYNKTILESSKKELIEEIIYQIIRSKSLQNMIHKHNGFNLERSDIEYSEIWYEWDFNGEEIKQNPKKWGNNIYNQKFRPSQNTDYSNLFLGGAHTKTSIDIWSMEGAVESGKRAADLLSKKYKNGSVYLYTHGDPNPFTFLKYIDNILNYIGLPNVIDTSIFLFAASLALLSLYVSKRIFVG